MSWRDDAACLGMDPALFYPERGDTATQRIALATCADCPSIDPCLAWALQRGERGVWGATNEKQRSRMRRALGIAEPEEPFEALHQPVLVIGDHDTYQLTLEELLGVIWNTTMRETA